MEQKACILLKPGFSLWEGLCYREVPLKYEFYWKFILLPLMKACFTLEASSAAILKPT